ncbi:hypothetical protein [Parafrankia sp. FMc2]|uniref:hypothetical protein n=1 Tax=Parafrankia sp. FMc2 TaxID=3233196 RepID=UPI0034D72AAF
MTIARMRTTTLGRTSTPMTMTRGGGMNTMATGPVLVPPVMARGVVTPFVDAADVTRCALDLGLRPGEYTALPFTDLRRIVVTL